MVTLQNQIAVMTEVMVNKGIECEQQIPSTEEKKDARTKNIQVIALDDYNLKLLRTIDDENTYNFTSLIDMDMVRGVEEMNIDRILEQAYEKLEENPNGTDGIITFIDFPAIDIMAYLTDRYKYSGPTLESVLKCNHKLWSRRIQKQIISENVPDFCSFDPYAKDPLSQIHLSFPFWIKPVNSYRSHLGFRINNEEDFQKALPILRRDIPRLAEPFNKVINLVDLPKEIECIDAHTCMAESIISGSQCTLEGYAFKGEVEIYGVVDSIRGANRSSFERYQYPSQLPLNIQEKMSEISQKVIKGIGFDNGAFNIEYFYNKEEDQIWLLEINPRISQSHCELFRHVDGSTHHKVMVDLALGKKPEMPQRQGNYKVAAKYFIRTYEDGVVSRAPSEADLEAIQRSVPGVSVMVQVNEGQRLSDLEDQDSYSYELGWVWIGARDQQELKEKYDLVVKLLDFRLEIRLSLSAS